MISSSTFGKWDPITILIWSKCCVYVFTIHKVHVFAGLIIIIIIIIRSILFGKPMYLGWSLLFLKHTIHSGIYTYIYVKKKYQNQSLKVLYNHFINEQQHNQQPHVFQPNMLLKLYATHIRNKISNKKYRTD